MEAPVYSKEIKESGKVSLPVELFDVEYNEKLITDVFKIMVQNKRIRTAHTKTREEVRGGGKKPWRQKGLGRARHGSIRSPIWRGGGITFGPRAIKDARKKINKKVKSKAFTIALSKKFRNKEIIFLEATVKEVLDKTKASSKFLQSFFETVLKNKRKEGQLTLFVLPNRDGIESRGLQNIKGIKIVGADIVSMKQLIDYRYVFVLNPEETIKNWSKRIK